MSRDADQRKPATETLSTHLWDLRAQAEAKLRCLTRLQQSLDEYKARRSEVGRDEKRQHILTDLNDIVTISKSLHDLARMALDEAMRLS